MSGTRGYLGRLQRACGEDVKPLLVRYIRREADSSWHFIVEGTTFGVAPGTFLQYDVHFDCESKVYTCSCHDYTENGSPACKHMMTILYRIAKTDIAARLWDDKTFDHQELDANLRRALRSHSARVTGYLPIDEEKEEEEEVDEYAGRVREEVHECPICLTEIASSRSCEYYTAGKECCSAKFHQSCAEQWMCISKTCPICKRAWNNPLEKHGGKEYDTSTVVLK